MLTTAISKRLFGIAFILTGITLLSWAALRPIAPAEAAGTDDFIITVKTDNSGTSTDTQFTIPTTGGGYNYNVDCNSDGSDEATAQTGDYTCDYSGLGGAGTYTVTIEDNSGGSTGFPRIYFNGGGDTQKLLSIEQWGSGQWTSMDSAFEGASNMVLNATDVPDLSNVTDVNSMFRNATSLTTNPAMNSWDTSSVEDMRYLFEGATNFNQDISGWDTSTVNTMESMFEGATAFN